MTHKDIMTNTDTNIKQHSTQCLPQNVSWTKDLHTQKQCSNRCHELWKSCSRFLKIRVTGKERRQKLTLKKNSLRTKMTQNRPGIKVSLIFSNRSISYRKLQTSPSSVHQSRECGGQRGRRSVTREHGPGAGGGRVLVTTFLRESSPNAGSSSHELYAGQQIQASTSERVALITFVTFKCLPTLITSQIPFFES